MLRAGLGDRSQALTDLSQSIGFIAARRYNTQMGRNTLHPRFPALFIRHIALPQDHGSWVFLLSPLLIGLFAGKNLSNATLYLILASLAVFLLRQPFSIVIKAYSGRRTRRELPTAWFWVLIYSLIAISALFGLISHGFGYLLYLAIPGIPVFVWHLYLVSRRAERRQVGIELVGSGVLALSAPAAYWVGIGFPDPNGWLLFSLTWLQSAASIVYAYLRLGQRDLDYVPDLKLRFQMGRRALIYASFNLLVVILLSFIHLTPALLFLPFGLQWIETLQGVLRPAIHSKPTAIGVRQLIVSTIFTIWFIIIIRI